MINPKQVVETNISEDNSNLSQNESNLTEDSRTLDEKAVGDDKLKQKKLLKMLIAKITAIYRKLMVI